MKKIYLCGHTGSMNRGCEAIVKSISYILEKIGISKEYRFLLTYDKDYDEFLNLNKCINLIQYPKRNTFIRGMGYIYGKIFKDNGIGFNKNYFKKVFNCNSNEIILFSIGGDTYCYSTPTITYACNEYAKEKNISNIFYGCSIDTKTAEKIDMCKDINKYSYIITRESKSKEVFMEILEDKSKLFYACDPAFQLPIEKTDLPLGFKEKNTLGINLSGLVFNDFMNESDIMYKNIYNLINFVLKKTEMNVCLIPHVYNIKENSQDIFVLNKIYNKYIDNSRISIVNKELSCTELKYIISKCRFFIGARTHATIAAYSTEVPTIALSYSIKSRGIAKDLFGKEDGFLIKWQDVKNENDIKNIFENSLLKNEKEILENYKKILPKYKETIINVTKNVLENLGYKNEK